MSLIKEALDKAQEKTAGTSSDDVDVSVGESIDRASTDRRTRSESSLVQFLIWSGVVLAVALLAGFEAVYLLSMF